MARSYTTPSKEMFKELLAAFQKWNTPTPGFELSSGRVGFNKANAMLWTLDQASGDLRRELLLASTCLNILRDERHARMHLRFRSDMGYGYLGQSHNHKPDALGITEATVAVVKRACYIF